MQRFQARDLSAPWRHVDIALAAFTVLIIGFGLVMLYSATRRFDAGLTPTARQGLFAVVGLSIGAGVALVNYRKLLDWWIPIYGVAMVFLFGVLTPLGSEGDLGTQGWYRFGIIDIQPVEFAKLATVIGVAGFMATTSFVGLKRLVGALILLGIPMGLTLAQPDLGSSLVFIVAGLGLLLIGGVQLRYLLAIIVIGVVGIVAIINSDTLSDYQRDRLLVFANPDSVDSDVRYNAEQAQTAISAGGLTGYGFGNGPSTRLGYVPAQTTDFIFTVVGEEHGFVGAGLLVLLFAGMCWRLWRIASLAADPFGLYMVVGILMMVFFHVFENIGMNLGIMPITGIPLPFVSQGGSSMMTFCIAMGLAQSVHMHRYS